MEWLPIQCVSPLDNDMILEIILEALSSAELVKSRLVSKRWEEHATKVLKKRRDLVVKLDCKTIEKFTSSMQYSRKPAFSCYDLECVYYGDDSFQKFTKVCGDSIKTLKFYLPTKESEYRVSKTPGCSSCLEPLKKEQLSVENDLIQNVILQMENTLEVLEFRTTPFSNLHTSVDVKVTFQSHCNIVELSFPFPKFYLRVEWVCPVVTEICSGVFNLANSLVVDSSNGEISLMKSCGILDLVAKLKFVICVQFLEELLDSNIALGQLDVILSAIPSRTCVDMFSLFLKTQCKSLKVLSLTDSPFWGNELKFPIMQELVEMKIEQCSYESVVHLLEDLDTRLPKLRRLSVFPRLNENERSKLESLLSNNGQIGPFARIESLRISISTEDVMVLTLFGKRFPNITKLHLCFVTSSVLSNAFTVTDWGLNLKELRICFAPASGGLNISRDCEICGFEYRWRESLGRKLLILEDQGAIFREAEASIRRLGGICGITQFQNLEKLSFEESCSKWNIERRKHVNFFISDLTIYFALVNLKRLRSLSISGDNMITPKAIKYLKDNCPVLCSVVIEDFDVCSWP